MCHDQTVLSTSTQYYCEVDTTKTSRIEYLISRSLRRSDAILLADGLPHGEAHKEKPQSILGSS
jgi:hypothetical protein